MNKKNFKSTGADFFLSDTPDTSDNTGKNVSENTHERNITAEVLSSNENTGVRDLLNKVSTPEQKDRLFPHTIYLSEKTGNELIRLSQKAHKSKSAFIDELLTRIFFN